MSGELRPGTTMARIADLERRVNELEEGYAKLLELGQVGADWVRAQPGFEAGCDHPLDGHANHGPWCEGTAPK